MAQVLTGTLHGDTIRLDKPDGLLAKGQRVRVVVEPLDSVEEDLSREEHARRWKQWVEEGPQGPIDNGSRRCKHDGNDQHPDTQR